MVFRTDYSYEKYLMYALTSTVNTLCMAEMEYHGKCVHTLGRIQNIAIMSIIDFFYRFCYLVTQTVAPRLPYFQGISFCIQYLASNPHKPIVILLMIMVAQISSDLYGLGIQWKNKQPIIV